MPADNEYFRSACMLSSIHTAFAVRSGIRAVFTPADRFPQLQLVPLGIEDPGELPVLVRLRLADELHASLAQLVDQRIEVVHAIVDHERSLTRAEPLAPGI